MGIEVEPLSEETLPSAIECVRASFTAIFRETDLPERSLKVSLDPSLASQYDDMKEISYRPYWVGVEDRRVAALIGLMTISSDQNEADWLNWFCVHPDFRSKGYGSVMLDHAVIESTRRKKQFLRLWTSNGFNESAAQGLYDKMGFYIVSEEAFRQGDATVRIYREKRLSHLAL